MKLFTTDPQWRGGYALLPAPRAATELATFTASLIPEGGTLIAPGLTIKPQASKAESWLGCHWPTTFERIAWTVSYPLLYAALAVPRTVYGDPDNPDCPLVLAAPADVVVLDGSAGARYRGSEIVSAKSLAPLMTPGACRVSINEQTVTSTDNRQRIRVYADVWFFDRSTDGRAWEPVSIALDAPMIAAFTTKARSA